MKRPTKEQLSYIARVLPFIVKETALFDFETALRTLLDAYGCAAGTLEHIRPEGICCDWADEDTHNPTCWFAEEETK